MWKVFCFSGDSWKISTIGHFGALMAENRAGKSLKKSSLHASSSLRLKSIDFLKIYRLDYIIFWNKFKPNWHTCFFLELTTFDAYHFKNKTKNLKKMHTHTFTRAHSHKMKNNNNWLFFPAEYMDLLGHHFKFLEITQLK